MMTDDILFDPDSGMGDEDSTVLHNPGQPRLLHVYATEPLVVVGFGGESVPPDHNVAAYREELLELLLQHDRMELAFDLTGVVIVPSGIVGLLVSLARRGIDVSVFNACPDVREVFAITQVDQMVTLHDVPVSDPSDSS